MVLFYKLREMQQHSLGEKSVDLRRKYDFSQYGKTYTVKLEPESFFLSKTTVLCFEEKCSSDKIDGMLYLSINQSFAWSMSFTPWRNDNTQDLAEVEQMFTCSSLM